MSSSSSGGVGPSRRRGHEYEGPSSSRRRAVNEVWPEPFVESFAVQVAVDASRSLGRLAAAAALANVFQACGVEWSVVREGKKQIMEPNVTVTDH